MNENLMAYIGSESASAGPRKYQGEVASGYDAKRQNSPKWQAEQEIIEGIIDSLPKGASILDVPVGTGRFIPAYDRNEHICLGIDVSEAMLAEAAKKSNRIIDIGNRQPHQEHLLKQGDVTDLRIGGEKFDLSIMCRLTRWLTPEQRVQALKELQRVTSKAIVFTARIANHPYAYPLEEIEAALDDDWQITHNIECGEPDYRVIVLEPA